MVRNQKLWCLEIAADVDCGMMHGPPLQTAAPTCLCVSEQQWFRWNGEQPIPLWKEGTQTLYVNW